MTPWGMRMLHMGCGEPLSGSPGLAGRRPGAGTPTRPPRTLRPPQPGREHEGAPR